MTTSARKWQSPSAVNSISTPSQLYMYIYIYIYSIEVDSKKTLHSVQPLIFLSVAQSTIQKGLCRLRNVCAIFKTPNPNRLWIKKKFLFGVNKLSLSVLSSTLVSPALNLFLDFRNITFTNCHPTICIYALSVDIGSSTSFFVQQFDQCLLVLFYINCYATLEYTVLITDAKRGGVLVM